MPPKDMVRRKMSQKQHQLLKAEDSKEEQLLTHDALSPEAEHNRPDPRVLTPHNIMQLQRTIGNQAVMRFLGQAKVQRQGGSPVSLHSPTKIQRVWENTIEHATKLRDGGKITVFDDRVQHAIDEHGLTNGKVGPGWYKFQTDDLATVKGYIEGTLKSGTIKLGHRDSYDFECSFTGPIGVNSKGATTAKMRVVVVQLGAKGDRGKIMTAYPIV